MPRAKGAPKTGGRKKGTPNKATAEVKALAQAHGPAAIKKLAELVAEADTDAAKISAANAILDRAYGKPTQKVGGDDDEPPINLIAQIQLVGPDDDA